MPIRFAVVVFLLAGCAEPEPEELPVPGRWYTATQVAAGEVLYALHCAACHGADGSATPDWRIPDAAGNYPPPPLNGTAHTWHHPLAVLESTIAEGGQSFGGLMPGFAVLLPADDRYAVIAWFQSLWADDLYARWKEIDERSR